MIVKIGDSHQRASWLVAVVCLHTRLPPLRTVVRTPDLMGESWCLHTDGLQFTVQKLDQLYVLVSSAHKTTRHDMTTQQAIGYQKEIKKTLGKTSETDAYLKFEMTSYVKCQTDL